MEMHADIILGGIVPRVFLSKALITRPNACLSGN